MGDARGTPHREHWLLNPVTCGECGDPTVNGGVPAFPGRPGYHVILFIFIPVPALMHQRY